MERGRSSGGSGTPSCLPPPRRWPARRGPACGRRRSRQQSRPSTAEAGEVVGEHEVVAGAGEDARREERVALVAVRQLELLLEVLEESESTVLDVLRAERATRSSVAGAAPRSERARVRAEEPAQPPRDLLPPVGVVTQLLVGDLPEDAAPPERRAATGELAVAAEDECCRAPVHLAVVHVVRELVEVDVALLAARRLRRVREDARELLRRAVRLERQLRLAVDDEALLVRERQLLVDLTRDEDLLLRVVEVVGDEDGGVLRAEVAARECLEGEEELEADLRLF